MSTYFTATVKAVGPAGAIQAIRRKVMEAEMEKPAESFEVSSTAVGNEMQAVRFASGKSRVEPQLAVVMGSPTEAGMDDPALLVFVVRCRECSGFGRFFRGGTLVAKDEHDEDNSAWEAFAKACKDIGVNVEHAFRG